MVRGEGSIAARSAMNETTLNELIVSRGRELYAALEGEKPSLFEEGRWVGRMMAWALKRDDLRTNLLRFVDVFPALTTSVALVGHLEEYFATMTPLPSALRWTLKLASGEKRFASAVLARFVRFAIEKLGRQFIVGENRDEAIPRLRDVRREGCAFSVDILGEAVLSEAEASKYSALYIDLLDSLFQAQPHWPPLDAQKEATGLDWGHEPKLSVSLKPTSLYSQARPQNFEGSVEAMLEKLRPLYKKIIDAGGSLCIDMESYSYKDMSLELFKRLRGEFPSGSHLSIAIQSYLRDTDGDLADLIAWSRKWGLPISIRLVKGAYWDYEIMRSRQNGWRIPVYTEKVRTDAAFERHARLIMENHEAVYFACGSHNLRSLAAVLETARALGVPEDRYEFQVLYGMAEPIKRLLVKAAGRVRLYCPYGKIIPGMAYLVRRLLENTANQGFLRLAFADKTDISSLLEDPSLAAASEAPEPPPFSNEPVADFTSQEERDLFRKALSSARRKLGRACPLFIDGSDRVTEDVAPSINPADPEEIVAFVAQAGKAQVDEAIEAAQAAFGSWRDTEPVARAAYLTKAAAWMRGRRYDLAASQILEIGKQWDQASADVAEAIDYLEYYAKEMVRLGAPQTLPSPPGEHNRYLYEPRGVAAVIAPWNFPLAITTGMVSAAIVTGNCVVYKPSPLTPAIGYHLVEAFRAAGLPRGVFNFLPGRTEEIAEHLVSHPSVTTIAFTGSTQVGLRIIEKASVTSEGQGAVKRVIAEMGGKNAIIIDQDADLDEAVPAVLVSAFGFQGQKCSSCSRVIVVEPIYDEFVGRLVEGARSLPVGPADDPAFVVGPVCDGKAKARISTYIDLAAQEGTILYRGGAPTEGNYASITIVGDIRPEHRIAQEEIFGPVLAIMRVKNFDEAIEWANSTRFALTGGVFSRSPRHLEEAKRGFKVGNLYLNRQITGALVGRQPFGGFRMSGLGTKAGGPEYLLHFMDPRVITENTARRGFSPDIR
jgi:RHH-type proline utilization regulon transcriptional repressor/proline dehydrogenase/delta 1-pyrroline-5-carboxylate dehydrogenase